MNPTHNSSDTRSSGTRTRRAAARRLVLAALLSVGLGAAAVPVLPSVAQAVGTRTTQLKVSCNFGGTPRNPTATTGTSYACTVNVGDTGQGTTVRPTGTANVAVTGTAGAASVSSCTLQPVANNNWDTTCTVYLVVYAAGTMTVDGTYAGDNTFNTSITAAKDEISGVTVSAGANPAVVTTARNTNGSNAPGSLALGDAFSVIVANCTATNAQGYVLIGQGVDPNTTTSFIIGPLTVGANKSYTLQATIDANQTSGTFVARYVCASGTVTSNSDPDIVFKSNTYTTTISTGAALRAEADPSSSTVVRSARVADPTDSSAMPLTATLTFDTDAPNSTDQFGILKESSDALKARTDRLVAASGAVSRLGYLLVDGGLDRATTERWTTSLQNGTAGAQDLAAQLVASSLSSAFTRADDAAFVEAVYVRGAGRPATAGEVAAAAERLRSGAATRAQIATAVASSPEAVAHWAARTYTVAAFQATTARMPTEGELAGAVARLRSGTLKVNVVEDVALLAAPASEWNATVPNGRVPAAAVFSPQVAAPAPRAAAPPAAASAPRAAAPAAPRTTRAPKTAARRKAPARRTPRVATRRATVRRTAPKAVTAPKVAPAAPVRKAVARRTATVRAARR